MRLAILTQPLTNNYGGILQNYAMQEILRRMGHEVTTLDVCCAEVERKYDLHFFLSIIKRFFQKYIRHDLHVICVNAYEQISKNDKPQYYQQRFIDENIKVDQAGPEPLSEINDVYDGYVVGSDQVWRPCFSSSLSNFYLDFVRNANAKRIAYAVSFGVDNWEADEQKTLEISRLAQKFDAISVREFSGIDLCKTYLGVRAERLIDPTALLTAEDYRNIYKKYSENREEEPYIASYFLDYSSEINNTLKEISKFLNLPIKKIGIRFASIESWLEGIDKASYVITDSFHGSMFSILFGKQFVSLGNKSRGMTRFDNLFSQLNLPNRLVNSEEEAINSLKTPIDYNCVHKLIAEERTRSLKFLDKHLC